MDKINQAAGREEKGDANASPFYMNS